MDRMVNINDVSHHVSGSVVQAGVVYGDVHMHQARPAVPRQLPAPPAHFTDRDDELATLAGAIAGDPDRAGPAMAVVTGPGGVGKTALALHWLHGEPARFPDGQLYADLSAHGPNGPAAPVEILGGLLHGLGVPSRDLPPGVDQRAGLYRSMTAAKSVVVLLDDAASSAQVRVLLPASRRSAVVVTSRRRLRGLVAHGGRTVPLDALAPDAAVELLRRVVGGDRVASEPAPARDVAVLCGGMPIALHVAAARLVVRPHWRVSRVAAELTDERRRLRALVADDGDLSVEACFDLSYRGLPPAAARLYRLLGLYPGTDFGHGAAAALVGSSEVDAEDLLGVLVEANMVADPAPDRYRLHDLMRLHARRRAERQEPEPEQARAVRSVVSWFLAHAAAADLVVTPLRRHLGTRTPAPVGFGSRASALDWLERELPNLLACLRTAFTHGWDGLVWQLYEALWGLYLYRGHHAEWITAGALAVEAAARCGDLVAESRMIVQAAAVHLRLGDPEAAVVPYRRAMEVAVSAGDWQGEATALEGLGAVAHARGRLPEAVEYYRRSFQLNEAHRRQRGMALLLCYLGHALTDLNDLDAAVEHFERSAALAASIGDGHCQAQAVVGIGSVHAARGAFAEAIARLEEGLRSLPPAEAAALRVPVLEKLAELLSSRGDHEGARRHWEEALATYTAMADPRAERIRALLQPPAPRTG